MRRRVHGEDRRRVVAFGLEPAPLEVVAFVGDNIHDFPAASQKLRGAPAAAFGDRYFVVPNPMYGSWQ